MIKKVSIAVLVIFIATCIFVLGRQSKPTVVLQDNKYQHQYDSLLNVNKAYEAEKKALNDSISNSRKTILGLLSLMQQNNEDVKKQKNIISHFTPDSRNAWNDSVLRAAGLK